MPNRDLLSFRNELHPLAVLPHQDYISFALPLFLHPHFSLVRMVSSRYVLTSPVGSFAGGNAPATHPEISWDNQNIKIQTEGGALQTQSPPHVSGLLSDEGVIIILYKPIFCFLGENAIDSTLKAAEKIGNQKNILMSYEDCELLISQWKKHYNQNNISLFHNNLLIYSIWLIFWQGNVNALLFSCCLEHLRQQNLSHAPQQSALMDFLSHVSLKSLQAVFWNRQEALAAWKTGDR